MTDNLGHKVGVIIATSMDRTESLFSLSLRSVLQQKVSPDCVVVVDDNSNESVCREIERRIQALNNPQVVYIRNRRTIHMSGTGAWNTGIAYLKEKIGESNYVAILDDDDFWDSTYIENIKEHIVAEPDAVFAFLMRSDCEDVSRFSKDDLTINNFLIGNPGIQGSNMCFQIRAISEIDGFDENMASCTDRDLMIRFLQKFGSESVVIVDKKLVNHVAGKNTVTSNFHLKERGLDYFYWKHIKLFDYKTLDKSLQRARDLFSYPNSETILSLFRSVNVILITGVCGMIGSHIARRFKKLGYIVVGIDNLSTGVLENISDFIASDNFTFLNLDLNDKDRLKQLFVQFQPNYVFHFAALPRIKYSIDFPSESYTANVCATNVIAKITAESNARLFVFASSSSVYGQGDGGKMSETDPLRPMSPYAEQKIYAERILKETLCPSESNLVILRLFNIYGYSHQPVNTYSTLIGKQIADIYNNYSITINGTGTQKRDFTYIDDVVEAAVRCVEVYPNSSTCEIINIGYGSPVSVNDASDLLLAFFNRKISKIYNSAYILEPDYTLADNLKAERLLGWRPKTDLHSGIQQVMSQTIANQCIVIGVAMHNNSATIRRCLNSVLKQQGLKRQLKIVVGDDNSTDDWRKEIADMMQDERVTLLSLSNNNVVLTRNAINDFICNNYPTCVFVGRLDADDEYSSEDELVKIEVVFDVNNSDIISAGNYLREDDKIIERKNPTDKKLSDSQYLCSRLKQMSNGIPEGELPSCNLFIRPQCMLPYPDVASGEDHALFVNYLTRQDRYNIFFAENLFPVIYNLGGTTTSANRKSGNYMGCRKELFNQTLELCRTK